MWALSNTTPYAAERAWIQDKHGRKHWLVAVRATYDIEADGRLSLADEQCPVDVAPVYRGDEGASSLRYDSDLLAFKPGTDVIVNGSAHAPHGRPTTRCDVNLRIADRNKALRIVGDRVYLRELTGAVTPSDPAAFTTMPIAYERAYGGYDDDDPDPAKHTLFAPNPVGVGVHTRSKLVGQRAPNVSLATGSSKKVAAGYGAVASHWHPRLTHAGTYDAAWVEHRKPLLPEDYDPRFSLSAPVDQQFIPHLRGGEPIELRGMTPSGVLRLAVPKVELSFTTTIHETDHHSDGWLVTVVIEPDDNRVMATWQTSLPAHRDMDYLHRTEITEVTPA